MKKSNFTPRREARKEELVCSLGVLSALASVRSCGAEFFTPSGGADFDDSAVKDTPRLHQRGVGSREMASPITVSWNQIIECLERLESLREWVHVALWYGLKPRFGALFYIPALYGTG